LWGDADKKPRPDSKIQPVLSKPVIAELGGVNPVIVVPGEWTAEQLRAHAQQLVVQKMANNGHFCTSPQILVTCKNWPERLEFLAQIRNFLQEYPGTKTFYPRCDLRYKEQVQHLPQILSQSEDSLICPNPVLFPNQQLHPALATGVPLDSSVLHNESFYPPC